MPKSWLHGQLKRAGVKPKILRNLAERISRIDEDMQILRSKFGESVIDEYFGLLINDYYNLSELEGFDRGFDRFQNNTRNMVQFDEYLPTGIFRGYEPMRLTFLDLLATDLDKVYPVHSSDIYGKLLPNFDSIQANHGHFAKVLALISTEKGKSDMKEYLSRETVESLCVDKTRDKLFDIFEFERKIRENTLEGIILREGNIKKVVQERDKASIDNLESIGVNYAPFLNLSDPQIVRTVVDRIKSERSNSIYGMVVPLLRQKGLELEDLSVEDIGIYSDEIALAIQETVRKKPSVADKFVDLEDHINLVFSRGDVSFRYSTRSDEDRKLGDKCGDCTAKEGLNADKVNSWLADSLYQQMSLFYGTKFVGRMNLAVVQSSGKPMVLIDAIEFVPQARKINKYGEMARVALKEGVEKVKQIADSMGIQRIAAYTFSNSQELNEALKTIGYNSEKRYNLSSLRQKSIQEVMGVEREIPYFLQAIGGSGQRFERSITDTEKMHKFEAILNEGILKDKSNKDQLVNLVREGDMNTAATAILQYDLIVGDSSIYSLGMDQEEVSKGLRFLYGKTNLTKESRVKLTTIRKAKKI